MDETYPWTTGITTMTLPKDLKAVKNRIRTFRFFVRIVRTAFITLIVLSCLFVVGFIGSLASLLSSFGPPPERHPLPPATPQLRYARADCIRDIAMMCNKSFYVRQGDSIYELYYSDTKVSIEQEYDFKPYYVFCGRIQLTNPDILPRQPPLKGAIVPVRETDFFLVNRFNSHEASLIRTKGYNPEHYDRISVNFGYNHPQSSTRNIKITTLPSSWFEH